MTKADGLFLSSLMGLDMKKTFVNISLSTLMRLEEALCQKNRAVMREYGWK